MFWYPGAICFSPNALDTRQIARRSGQSRYLILIKDTVYVQEAFGQRNRQLWEFSTDLCPAVGTRRNELVAFVFAALYPCLWPSLKGALFQIMSLHQQSS